MTTWLEHVKKVHASGSTSYKESLKRASASWKKSKGKSETPKKKKRRGKAPKAEEKVSIEEPAAPAAPKKKRRRKAKKSMPKIPAAAFKSVDSRSL